MSAVAVDAERALTRDGFAEVLEQQLGTEIEIWPARAWYPSSIAHPCDRHLVWRATRWERQAKHGPVLQSIFDQGRDHQPLIYRRLERMGFEIVRESDRPVQYKIGGGAVISGRPDGRVVSFRKERYRPSRVLEVKSMAGHQWDRTATVDDIRDAPSHWTRSYYAQGQLYAFLENLPMGVFVLESKATGMLKAIPFELDYGYAEELLKRIERLQPMIAQGVDPEPIPFDGLVCGGCGFQRECYPPRDYGEGTAVLDDPALVEDLEAREKLKPARDHYEDLDKSVKVRLKQAGIKSAVAGPFTIEASERPVSGYTVKPRVDTIFEIRRAG